MFEVGQTRLMGLARAEELVFHAGYWTSVAEEGVLFPSVSERRVLLAVVNSLRKRAKELVGEEEYGWAAERRG